MIPLLDPTMVRFTGRRLCGSDTAVHIVVDGLPRPLPLHLAVANHSPTGFEWGYAGSGPAQLALAMCVELVGPRDALQVYQRVKDTVVAPLTAKAWSLTGCEVMAAIDAVAVTVAG